jgi:hypothetical protein
MSLGGDDAAEELAKYFETVACASKSVFRLGDVDSLPFGTKGCQQEFLTGVSAVERGDANACSGRNLRNGCGWIGYKDLPRSLQYRPVVRIGFSGSTTQLSSHIHPIDSDIWSAYGIECSVPKLNHW